MHDSQRPFTLQQLLRRCAPTLSDDDKISLAMNVQQQVLNIKEDAEGNTIPDDLDHVLNAIFRTEMVGGTQTPAEIEREIAQYRIDIAKSELFKESLEPWKGKEPSQIAPIAPRKRFKDTLGEDSDNAAMIIRANIDCERELLLSIRHYAYMYTLKKLGITHPDSIDEKGENKDGAYEFKYHLGLCRRHICYMAGSGESDSEEAKRLGRELIQVIEARANKLILTALSNDVDSERSRVIAPAVKPKMPAYAAPGKFAVLTYQSRALTPPAMLSALVSNTPLPERQQLVENIMGALIPTQNHLENIFTKCLPTLSLQYFYSKHGNNDSVNQVLNLQVQLAENPDLRDDIIFDTQLQDVEKKLRETDGNKTHTFIRSAEKFAHARQQVFNTLRAYAHLYTAMELQASPDDLETNLAASAKIKDKINAIFGKNALAVYNTIENGAKTLALKSLAYDWYRPNTHDSRGRGH